MIGSKAVGTSGYHSNLVIQTFDRCAGNFAFGSKPVQDQFVVDLKHAGHLSHRFDPAAHGPLTPIVQEASCPPHRFIAPEMLETFLQHPSPSRSQFTGQEALEFDPSLTPHAATATQQLRAHVFEPLHRRAASQSAAFGSAHLVHRLVEVHRDVETVQHVQGLRCLGGHHLQIGLPHIAADKTQSTDDFPAHRPRPAPQRGRRAPPTHPRQSSALPVALVDDGQKALRPFALAPMNLVDANRLHSLEFAFRQAPLHQPFHRPVNRFPTGPENSRRFPPGQAPRPSPQKFHHRHRHRPLAIAPGHIFHHHPVLLTLDPSESVDQPHRDLPQRHTGPNPRFQHVIPRAGLQALGTSATNPLMGLQPHFNPRRYQAAQANAAVNESNKMLNQIENPLHLQLSGWFAIFHTRFTTEPANNSQPLLLLHCNRSTHLTFGTLHFPRPPLGKPDKKRYPTAPRRWGWGGVWGRAPELLELSPSTHFRRPEKFQTPLRRLPTNSATEPFSAPRSNGKSY